MGEETKMTVEVVCPFCGNTRSVVPPKGSDGKIRDKRVRCLKGAGGCGKPFHTASNMVIVVPQRGTKKIFQDKVSNKNEIIKKISDQMEALKEYLPLDILRSKLLEIESIGEMRKK